MFSGTVSDNIALTNPEASSEDIIRAARLANAHDFIMDLPSGYSTLSVNVVQPSVEDSDNGFNRSTLLSTPNS